MITKQDALTADRFHEDHEPAGKIYEWRRNGATQTWKTRPDDFRIPVKYGYRSTSQLTQADAHRFHRADQCPTRHVRVTMPEDSGEWFGIVTSDQFDGQTRVTVQVTTKGKSKHRVGSRVEVDTAYITDL